MSIVVAVDGSEHSRKALALAIDLAGKLGTKLVAVSVAVPPFVPPEPYSVVAADLEHAVRENAESIAKGAAGQARAAGVAAEGVIEEGAPAECLCRAAEAHQATMIVAGHRGQNALRRVLLGSVSSRLVHVATIPVLIVP